MTDLRVQRDGKGVQSRAQKNWKDHVSILYINQTSSLYQGILDDKLTG